MNLTIFSDGGSRGNPGAAAIGVVIYNEGGSEIKTIKKTLGIATNNQAEYRALLAGLREALVLQAENVMCFLDSELVVKQLKGQYKIKEPSLQPLASEVLAMTSKFKSISFAHVRREKNSRADELVNQALDEAEASK